MSIRESGGGWEIPASQRKALLGGGGFRVVMEAKPGNRSVPSPYYSAAGLKKILTTSEWIMNRSI